MQARCASSKVGCPLATVERMKRKGYTQALAYHRRLPEHLWYLLDEVGIVDGLVHAHLLGYDGEHVAVPIWNRSRDLAFFEYWEESDDGFIRSPHANPEHKVELFGWETLLRKPERVFLVEDSIERLVLTSQAFAVVSISGDAGAFRDDWIQAFEEVNEVVVCFKHRAESAAKADFIAEKLTNALRVELPQDVGEGGGFSDYFVRRKYTRAEFTRLVDEARTKSRDAA